MVEKRIHAHNILAVTFTKKAARELKERVAKLGAPGADRLLVSTFHSIAYRILRSNYRAAGFEREPIVWASDSDRRAVCREAMRCASPVAFFIREVNRRVALGSEGQLAVGFIL